MHATCGGNKKVGTCSRQGTEASTQEMGRGRGGVSKLQQVGVE